MTKYTTKYAMDFCYNCGCEQEFANTYLRGQKVETACCECGEVDSFPYDEEGDY